MKGFIYKLTSSQTEKCYIGSTTNDPQKRLNDHKSNYKYWLNGTGRYNTSYEIVKFGDVAMEILEEVEVESKKELHQIEGIYQRECDETVNKCIAGRTKKEYIEDMKQINPDHCKKLYQRRLERNPNHNKNHYQKYREKYLQRTGERVICECGCVLSRGHLPRHQRTQIHISKILELQSEELEERCQIRFFYNNNQEVKKFYIYASIEDVKRSIEGETRNPAELFSIL